MSWSKHSIPGGSLRAWRDYFPSAEIIGIDIDPDVMFTEERINTYVCDQTQAKSIASFVTQANLQPNSVDIIIDDGLHEFDANVCLFENTKHLLKDNGIYVIEDVAIVNKQQQLFIDYFKNISSYAVSFIQQKYDFLIVITKSY